MHGWKCASRAAPGPQVIPSAKPHCSKRKRHFSAEYTALLLLRLHVYLYTYENAPVTPERWKMKFTCSTKDIAAAVGAASKVVNAHTTVPILSNVLLTADDGKIAVRATDLGADTRTCLSGGDRGRRHGDGPGQAVLELSRQSAARERSNSAARRRAPASSASAPTTTSTRSRPTNIRRCRPPHEGRTSRSRRKRFRDGIDATIFAASSEEARGAVLMGTLLEIEGNALTMVATDGYRLAKCTTTLDDGIRRQRKVHRAVAGARPKWRAISGGGETIAVTALGAQSNQLQMTAGSVSITVRLVDGQYPNYEQVIPAKFDRSMTVNTSALIGGLRRAELVAGDRASMVKLAIANQTLIVTANSDISGNAYEELEVEQTGEDLTIAFNARYLVEILNHVKSDADGRRVSRAAFAGGDSAARAAGLGHSSSTS